MINLINLLQGDISPQYGTNFPLPFFEQQGDNTPHILPGAIVDLIMAVAAEGKNILLPVQAHAEMLCLCHGNQMMGLHVQMIRVSAPTV